MQVRLDKFKWYHFSTHTWKLSVMLSCTIGTWIWNWIGCWDLQGFRFSKIRICLNPTCHYEKRKKPTNRCSKTCQTHFTRKMNSWPSVFSLPLQKFSWANEKPHENLHELLGTEGKSSWALLEILWNLMRYSEILMRFSWDLSFHVKFGTNSHEN